MTEPPPGRVILLNGAPSTGKTTVARALWIEVAEQRERERAPVERHLGGPIPLRVPEWELVNANRPCDVEFDTRVVSVGEAVELIRRGLESTTRAFDRWYGT